MKLTLMQIDLRDSVTIADIYDDDKYRILLQTEDIWELGSFLDYAILKFKYWNKQFKDWDDWRENAWWTENSWYDYQIFIEDDDGIRLLFRASMLILSPMVENALTLAIRFHSWQTRKGDGLPYMIHILEISQLLFRRTYDPILVSAGLCHDLLEDTECKEDLILMWCGKDGKVLDIVKSVSNDKELEGKADWEKKKLKYIETVKNGWKEAMIVSIADKIVNLESLLRQYKKEWKSLWDKFNRGKEQKLWFEKECLKMAKENNCPEFLISRYDGLVKDLENLV